MKIQKYFRRCHVCGTVTEEIQTSVKECAHCGKHFAPFCFFDENSLEGIDDNKMAVSLWRDSTGYRPLWGISAPWEEGDEVYDEAR